MQLLQQKNNQSEVRKNLVVRTPVKERRKLSYIQTTSKKPISVFSLHKVKLEIEIMVYWLLCKYKQSHS